MGKPYYTPSKEQSYSTPEVFEYHILLEDGWAPVEIRVMIFDGHWRIERYNSAAMNFDERSYLAHSDRLSVDHIREALDAYDKAVREGKEIPHESETC